MEVDYNFPLFSEKYSYTKLWHELVTPIPIQRILFRFTCNRYYVKTKNIKWYPWTTPITEFLPENTDYFVPIIP